MSTLFVYMQYIEFYSKHVSTFLILHIERVLAKEGLTQSPEDNVGPVQAESFWNCHGASVHVLAARPSQVK
jgi:hypothetical protein